MLGRSQKRGFIRAVPGAVSSDGGEVVRVWIMDDGRTIGEIAHEIGKRKRLRLAGYGIVIGGGPPEGVGRKNSLDRIAKQRDAVAAPAKAALREKAEVAGDEPVLLEAGPG